MKVDVEYTGGAMFIVQARAHTIVCDQPGENGGSDKGMTPPELLLASLGTCAGYYATQYLLARSLPADGVRVSVVAEKAKAPARLGSFDVTVTIPAGADERHVQGVSRAVHSCLIHNTLLQSPAIHIAIGSESTADMAEPLPA
jgi:uncharacterized OsmC-like protein